MRDPAVPLECPTHLGRTVPEFISPLFLALLLLLLGVSQAEAAYRLTFQNGTSIVVPGYDDLGDAIRYPRFGGMVTVPKASVATIVELPPAPTPPAPQTSSPPASPPVPTAPPRVERPAGMPWTAPQFALPQPPVLTLPWRRVGDSPAVVETSRLLSGVALLVALIAVVVFALCTTKWSRENRTGDAGTTRMGPGRGKKPLGVVLVGIYDAVFGLMMIGTGLTGAMVGQMLAEIPVFLLSTSDPIAVMALSLALATFGAVALAAAYGMWSLQTWGWRLQAIVCLLDLAVSWFSLWVSPPSAGSLLAIAGLFLDSAVLIYISFPSVQRLYPADGYPGDDGLAPTSEEEPRTPSL